MISKVISTFTVNGFHAWSDAPLVLAYLSTRHRHLFTVKVEARVGHDNRQIEFHQLQRAAREAMDDLHPRGGNGNEYEFGSKSCEMLAAELLVQLRKKSWVVSAVEFWEDLECGARVEAEA